MSGSLLLADEVVIPGGLSTTAHVFLVLGTLLSVAFILLLLRRRQIRGKYAMLWTSLGLGLFVLALFPGLLTVLSSWLGITYPPALFAVIAIGFLLVVVIHFSWELTRLEDRSRTLAEEVALLRAELEREKADHGDAS